MIFNRLALGTANFGKEYNGVKVSEDEQKRILDYCQCSGIDMIDTATAYEWDWTQANSYFTVNVKSTKVINLREQDIGMAHSVNAYLDSKNLRSVSLYSPIEIPLLGTRSIDNIQIPYSIYDRRFEPYLVKLKHKCIEIHVRSIFLRGKLLEKFKPWECIAFCLMNPLIDRVIIGVDSLQQLKDNLRPFHRMNSAEIHDENILDPRKWEGEK